jgi:hypothetical protein
MRANQDARPRIALQQKAESSVYTYRAGKLTV